jgi:hypothetical protein
MRRLIVSKLPASGLEEKVFVFTIKLTNQSCQLVAGFVALTHPAVLFHRDKQMPGFEFIT